jgi:hypothetical protein
MNVLERQAISRYLTASRVYNDHWLAALAEIAVVAEKRS